MTQNRSPKYKICLVMIRISQQTTIVATDFPQVIKVIDLA